MPAPSIPPPPVFKSRYDQRTFSTQAERDRYDSVYHGAGGTMRDTELDKPYPIQLVAELNRESARVPTYRGPGGGTFTSKTEALQRQAAKTGINAPKLNIELVSDMPNPIAGTRVIAVRVSAGGLPVTGAKLAVDGSVATGETNAGGILKVLIPTLHEARVMAHRAGYTQSESYRLPPR